MLIGQYEIKEGFFSLFSISGLTPKILGLTDTAGKKPPKTNQADLSTSFPVMSPTLKLTTRPTLLKT